jgi:hypothetical protein
MTREFVVSVLKFGSDKYRLIGVPFYNNEDENQLKESLFDTLAK